MQPNQQAEDKAIFDSLQGQDSSFFDQLQEDEAAQLQAAVDRHKQRMSSAQKPQVQSQVQQQPSQDQNKQLQDAQFRARANDITQQPFWTGATQKASMGLVPLAADLGKYAVDQTLQGKALWGPASGDRQVGTQNRDYYKKAAQASTGASVAGSLVNPTNLVGTGMIGNALTAMGQVGLQDVAGGENVDPTKAAMAGGFSAAGSAISSAMTGGLSRFQDSIAQKLGPHGWKMVKDLARSIMMKGTNVDSAYLAKLQTPGTSKIGGPLQSAQDDAVYAVVNEIKPSILKSQGDVSKQIASNVNTASSKIGQVMDPIRQTPIDTNRLQKDMFNMSQRAGVQGANAPDTQSWLQDAAKTSLQPRSDAQRPGLMSFGQTAQIDAKNLARGQFGHYADQKPAVTVPNPQQPKWAQQLPQQQITAAQFVQPRDQGNTLPLRVVDEMSKGIQSQMYDPMAATKLGISNPQASGTRANAMLEDYIGQYMSPQGSAQFKQGNAQFARNKNVQQIMSPGLNKGSGQDIAASGLSTNPVIRTMSAGFNAAGKKIKTGLYQGTKGVAEYAVNRLNSRLPQYAAGQSVDLQSNKIMSQLAPFQKEAIARKFQTLSQMDATQAASFAYATSMTDPTFRAVFTAMEKQLAGGSK